MKFRVTMEASFAHEAEVEASNELEARERGADALLDYLDLTLHDSHKLWEFYEYVLKQRILSVVPADQIVEQDRNSVSLEGTEIHFDEKRGCLELACEPDAFRPYRELVRKRLSNFTEIAVEKITDINIVDTSTVVARRHVPRSRVLDVAFLLLFVVTATLAVIGAIALFSKFTA